MRLENKIPILAALSVLCMMKDLGRSMRSIVDLKSYAWFCDEITRSRTVFLPTVFEYSYDQIEDVTGFRHSGFYKSISIMP